MGKPVILTGLRANNNLHIGNYLGALLPMADMASKQAGQYQLNIFIPDLHSIITSIDYSSLQDQIQNNLRAYVAAGIPLDNPDVHIYRQSYIPAHSELTWILDSFTGMGELGRMIEYKEKSAKAGDDRVSVSLFHYPVLMAADILLYGTTYVPVGDDQRQHLEFTRDIAERFNKQFGDVFVVPKPVKAQHEFFGAGQGLRIRDLIDPAKKMSKSDETGKGVIFLTDSPDVAQKKIMSATTDSLGNVGYDYDTQPGISNLLDILELFGGNKQEFIGNTQYGQLKQATAERVAQFLESFQTKFNAIDTEQLHHKLIASEAVVSEVAAATLENVQKAVGLRP